MTFITFLESIWIAFVILVGSSGLILSIIPPKNNKRKK
jgi:hypothetical protein